MVRWVVAIVLLTVCAGCFMSTGPLGVAMRTKSQFEIEVRRYAKLPAQKSMAIAGDPQGIYVSGYAYDYPTKEVAVQEALRYCELRREDRGVEATCRTYAIDDKFLED